MMSWFFLILSRRVMLLLLDLVEVREGWRELAVRLVMMGAGASL